MLNKGQTIAGTEEENILLSERDGPVVTLKMNRPSASNSLSKDLITALQEAISMFADDETVRVLIIAANGPAFCAGHDLKELTAYRTDADSGRSRFQKIMSECSSMMLSITHCPKPVIAVVQGAAMAAGCQLVASCDLAIASDNATFCTPGVNIGLFCSTPMVPLSRNISRKRAMEMLLLGEVLNAREAETFGLVNRVVSPADLFSDASKLARKICQKSQLSVTIGKEAFYRQLEMPLKEAYDYTSQVMVENMMSLDSEEGIEAFLNKRKPNWSKRN